MCAPPGIMLMAASTAFSITQAEKQADKTNKWNQWQAGRVRANANRAALARYKAISARRKEQRENSAREIESISRQAARAAGITRLEGAGASVGTMLANIAAQSIIGKQTVKRREEFGQYQDQLEKEATANQAEGRALAAQRAPTLAPSLFSLSSFLRVGTAGYAGATDKQKEFAGKWLKDNFI